MANMGGSSCRRSARNQGIDVSPISLEEPVKTRKRKQGSRKPKATREIVQEVGTALNGDQNHEEDVGTDLNGDQNHEEEAGTDLNGDFPLKQL